MSKTSNRLVKAFLAVSEKIALRTGHGVADGTLAFAGCKELSTNEKLLYLTLKVRFHYNFLKNNNTGLGSIKFFT